MKAKRVLENTIHGWFLLMGLVTVGCVLLISVYLIISGIPAIREIGLVKFLFGKVWDSNAATPQFGILSFILTSVYGTAGAILLGVPVGFMTAVFLAKMAPPRLKAVVSSAVSLLAGIPSVVYGLVGMRLLLHQQPVAGDLRRISAALKMITDMERIGDQADDIAEIVLYLADVPAESHVLLQKMAEAAIGMVSDSVDAYVRQDVELAEQVIAHDDTVDDYFEQVKQALIHRIANDAAEGGTALDLLMIAKYLERIGDHATNIAEWVEFSVTGVHKEG